MEKTAMLITKYRRLMSKHPGKWVAIHNDKVIATSKNIQELTQKIKKLNEVFVAYSHTPREKGRLPPPNEDNHLNKTFQTTIDQDGFARLPIRIQGPKRKTIKPADN